MPGPTAKIMLVDDDAAFLEVFATLLGQHFSVQATQSPAEALRMLLEQGPYGVVVADLHMPGQDGLSFLREIKRQSPRTRTIMLTGHPDLRSAMEAVNDLGVVGFYTKGCPAEELIAKIRATLAARPVQTAADVLTQEEKDFFGKG